MPDRELSGSSPIYLQLREIVRSKIEENEYPPGCAIPSENELAETYGINRLTVRNGIDALVTEGLLKRVKGRGVFVVGDKVDVDLDDIGGFRKSMRKRGERATVKILAKYRRPAGSTYARILGINPTDEVFSIKCLNLMNDEPYELERIMTPVARVPQLDTIDLSVFNLNEVYGFYGTTITRDEELLSIVRLEARDARYLGVPSETPAMALSDVLYDDRDNPVECSRSFVRDDKCFFSVHF